MTRLRRLRQRLTLKRAGAWSTSAHVLIWLCEHVALRVAGECIRRSNTITGDYLRAYYGLNDAQVAAIPAALAPAKAEAPSEDRT